MKTFEYQYLCLESFLPTLYQLVRKRLVEITRNSDGTLRILDVGGRKSHYTIGVPARVTITDLPRERDVQNQLHLGITPPMISELQARRSNVSEVLLDDMTKSRLSSGLFHCIVAVEVLEHVEQDAEFIREVHRVLKPGGVFLMTTPNGHYVRNTNPDHKRHYTREALFSLLASTFSSVKVDYAVKGGFFYDLGLRSWSLKRPVWTAMAMLGSFINSAQSAGSGVRSQPVGTQELLAMAWKV
jgi:SAM-dependent methyltransferase